MWIWGLWNIPYIDRGGFHIWPENEEDPTGRHLRRQEHLPQRDEKPRLKLEPVGAGA
jgi:hypothetical protein